MPLFLLIVALPGAWLTLNMAVILQRQLPALFLLVPHAGQTWLVENVGTLLWLGPTLILMGLVLLLLEVVRHWAGMLLDSILIVCGGAMWLLGCLLSASVWLWLAVPVFTLLVTPAFTAVIILTLLATDDSIDGSLGSVALFTLVALALHLLLHGFSLGF